MMFLKKIPVVLLLSAASVLNVFGREQDKWAGKIETIEGRKIIRNPEDPACGEFVFELSEELSVGNEKDDAYKFYGVRGIEVNGKGDIFVSDLKNYRIQRFDKNGRYLQTYGRRGQGPGEFQLPVQIHINKTNQRLFVYDLYCIEVFEGDGTFVKSVRPQHFPLDFLIDSRDFIYAKLSYTDEEGEWRKFCKLDLDGNVVKNYGLFPFYHILQKKSGSGSTVVQSPWDPDLHIAAIDAGTFVFGFSLEYGLNVVDSSGKNLYRIEKEAEAEDFSGDETQQYRKSRIFNKLPPHKPFFYRILTDNEKRIYVQTTREIGRDIPERELDVFSGDGFYLYKTKLSAHCYVILNGCFYVCETDEEVGTERVKRYRIQNWGRFKKTLE